MNAVFVNFVSPQVHSLPFRAPFFRRLNKKVVKSLLYDNFIACASNKYLWIIFWATSWTKIFAELYAGSEFMQMISKLQSFFGLAIHV